MRIILYQFRTPWADRALRFAASVILACFGLCAMCTSAHAQEANELEEFRESLKQEILSEVLRELKIGLRNAEIDALKEQIKFEILNELRDQNAPVFRTNEPSVSQKAQPGEELRETVEEHLSEHLARHPQEVSLPMAGRGHAEGRILRRGAGFSGCQVKLVRHGNASGRFKGDKEVIEFQTVSDGNGNYRFENIPPGNYKLKWQLPGDTGWIHRINDKPDVTVEPGRTSVLNPIEMSKGLLPQ